MIGILWVYSSLLINSVYNHLPMIPTLAVISTWMIHKNCHLPASDALGKRSCGIQAEERTSNEVVRCHFPTCPSSSMQLAVTCRN